MAKPGYDVIKEKSTLKLRFIFFSKGLKNLVKVIDYDYVGMIYFGIRTFNLALGDYDPDSKTIQDDTNSDNGDVYDVLNTVLNTIPLFFDDYPDCILMVKGSDSGENFTRKCKAKCTKNCKDIHSCKNKNRRINIYARYVSANYDELAKYYLFYGAKEDFNEPFVKYKSYDTVFVKKH